MKGRNLWDGCRRAVYGILFFLVISLSAYIFYGALDTLMYADVLLTYLPGWAISLFLLGVSLLLCMAYLGIFRKLVPVLERQQGRAVLLLFGIMMVFQVLMILLVRTSLRQDHLKIFDTAAALLEKGTIEETYFRHYFRKYPNNIPLCLFTYFWLKAASALGIPRGFWMEFVKLVNLIFMNLGLFCTFSIVCKHRSRRMGLYFLLLLLLNPLWYLLGQMYYTSTISLAFSAGAVWLFDRARGQQILWKKYLIYLAAGVVLAFGYKIRATMIITAAALLIYGLLEIKQRGRLKELLSPGAVLAGAVLLLLVYGQVEKRYAGFDPSDTGYPMVHWVMMSAQGDGQYNSEDDAYTASFSTKEEQTAADFARLKERIQKMGPSGLFTLFRNKLRVTFSDGTDDYYGLFRTMQKASPLQKYINGGRSDYLAVWLHGYHGMMTGLLLLAFVFRAFRGEKNFLDLFVFQIGGAYLFYLIWEVDQAYSIPFMFLLLLWAADGMLLAEEGLMRIRNRLPGAGYLPVFSMGGLLLLAAGLVLLVHKSGGPVREYRVLQDQETGGSFSLQTNFSQTFRTGQAFDHVDVWVANWDGGANDSVYEIKIVDEAGNVAAGGEIRGAEAPCMAPYTVSFEKVEPLAEQTYSLEISLKNPDCVIKTDFLYYDSGSWDMYGEGALYVPEEIKSADLAFAVYEER